MFLYPCQEYWRGGNFLSCTWGGGGGGGGGEFSLFQTSCNNVLVKWPLGWDCSVSRVSDGKARHNKRADLMRLSQAGRGFFPPGSTSVQTLSPCWRSPHVQSHASASVQALANPKHWQPVQFVGLTLKNVAHAGRNGRLCSCGCSGCNPVRRPKSPTKD